MPGHAVAPGAGEQHARECLRLLAGWGLPEQPDHD
jgi:hypothetical protein